MFMNLDEKLLHKVDLYLRSSTKNTFGEYTYSYSKVLKCLVSGDKKRTHTDSQPQSTVQSESFSVTIKGNETITVGDELRNAKDYKGNAIFASGEIISIRPIIHKLEGVVTQDLEIANVKK